MRPRDLHILPTVADGLTFLYAERVRVERDASAVVLVDKDGSVKVPAAALSVLMLGPGSSITHAALTACAELGCAVLFTGEGGVRLYASGLGETRSALNLMTQAKAWADPTEHLAVVRRMYAMRFDDTLDDTLTLEQIRGKEGVRVREAYVRAARKFGIAWDGRRYGQNDDWISSTPANRAFSTACACLYGLCHAAIVAVGFSPALGFVHTGKALSFVYDIADLYKCELLVPIAFEYAASNSQTIDSDVRRACRDSFRKTKLIERIVPDMQTLFGLRSERTRLIDPAEDPAPALWDQNGAVAGAVSYAPRSRYKYTPPEHPHPEDA
jgi:CRISP-associated protein Cas1